MASPPAVFLSVAAIIAMGYLAGRFALATRFPDVAVLLVLGLVLGPINRVLADLGVGSTTLAGALGPERLHAAAPLVSGLALVVILFEAGLGMEVRSVRRSLGPAVRISLPVFLVTVVGVSAVGYWVYGMPAVVAAALGVALSNVGQTVSSALLRRMRLDDETRAVGLVEMALYDLISVPILVSLFLVAGGAGHGPQQWTESVQSFAQIASSSILVGGAAGVIWLLALQRLYGHPHSYMLTLAALLTVYAITERLGGAGAVSVLLFGLFIGNRVSLLRILRRPAPKEGEETKVQAFHEEVTFLVRTIFFLFLGLSFAVGMRGRWPVTSQLPGMAELSNEGLLFGIGAALILVSLPLARALVIPLLTFRNPAHRALIPVFGHGLGTAVLATLPFVWRDYKPGTVFHATFSPWEPVFVNLAFLVILFSVLGSSLLVFIDERQRRPVSGRAQAETISAPPRLSR